MANRTDKDAVAIRGTNPQNLIEYITRKKIYGSLYWKERCFGLSAETLIDNAVELNHVGGTYAGSQRPTEFICLILKMLQIQPDKEVIIELIKSKDNKYIRMLGAFYLRLTGKETEVYQYLEPLLMDRRKIRVRITDGTFALSHVDELVDNLLSQNFVFDTAMPRIQNRFVLEEQGTLDPRISGLQEDVGDIVQERIESVCANMELRETFLQKAERRPEIRVLSTDQCRLRARETSFVMTEIVVNDRLGNKVRIKCKEDDTVGDLKKIIAMKTGIRADKIRLQRWHNVLKDSITLADYEIHDGSGLELYYN